MDVAGTELQPEDQEILQHPLVGGVILFTRNYRTPEQLVALIRQIHAVRTPNLAICVDQEGGTIQRFREGFTPLPPARLFGKLYRRDATTAYQACSAMGWLMAAELRAVGVDISFAPVVDLDWGSSEVIGARAFHRDPFVVCDLASRYIAGMHKAGMKSVLKHFPGHGHVTADSHVDMPVDERSYEEIRKEDLVPFERLGATHGEGLMTAHVIFSQVDEIPVTFSHKWLQHVLRGQLGFEGVVFSDDLNMHAARVHAPVARRAQAAFQAGCDVVLLCNNRQAVMDVLDQSGNYHNPVSSMRLLRMRGKPADLGLEDLHQTPQWQQAADMAARHVDTQEPELGF